MATDVLIPQAFFPLKEYLPFWPHDFLGESNLLDKIGLTQFELEWDTDIFHVTGSVAWLEEIAIALPALDGLSLVLLNSNGITTVDVVVQLSDEIQKFQLNQLSFSIRIASNIVKPVKIEGERRTVLDEPLEITLENIDLSFDLEGNFDLTAPPDLTLDRFTIGETGIDIEAKKIGLDLSGKKGVTIEKVEVFFPPEFEIAGIDFNTIAVEDVFIGNKGFSGAISWNGEAGGTLLGFDFAITMFSLAFTHNIPTATEIKGRVTIPSLGEIEIGIAIDETGKLFASLGALDGELVDLTIENLIKLSLKSLSFDFGNYQLQASGSAELLYDLPMPTFNLENFTIDRWGNISLPGGWLEFPKAKTIDFKGFKFEISKFGFGSETAASDGISGIPWLGFSGRAPNRRWPPFKGER